jgi:hypothetical protein
MDNIDKTLDDFLDKGTITKTISPDGKEEEVCDLTTGECYIIRSRDGIVERINKRYITEDGRQLLQD